MNLISALEMWCRRQAAAAILPLLISGFLLGESSEALTTFGKSNTLPPYQPPQPSAQPALACRRQADCAGIAGTSCVRTSQDSGLSCLCGDNSPPRNGRCEPTPKGLHHLCSDGKDCSDSMICAQPNDTTTTNNNQPQTNFRSWSTSNQQQQIEKTCQCDQENGYYESDFACSGSTVADIPTNLLITLSIVLYITREIINY